MTTTPGTVVSPKLRGMEFESSLIRYFIENLQLMAPFAKTKKRKVLGMADLKTYLTICK